MGGAVFADGIPARFMLPVVMPAAQGEVLLGPNNLRANLEAAGDEPGGDFGRVYTRMPDIRYRAGKQLMGGGPIDDIVMANHAGLPWLAETRLLPPLRIVLNTVGWIGDHQRRLRGAEQPLHRSRVGGIAAEDAVPPIEYPEIAESAHR